MNLQDWLEKARGHKYIRKYVGPGGKTYYEYMTPGGQKVSVPSRGAAAAEKAKAAPAPKKEPPKPTAAGTETIKEAVEKTAEKIKVSVPTDKEVKQVKQEVMAKEEIAKTFGLASQVVRAAIPKADREATLKAARALLAVAKQPGQKGKVLGELRALAALARAQAKMINNRYNADRNRDKPPRGRDFLYTYDDVLAQRGVRDLIDKARSKVSSMKAKNPETTRTPPNPEFPNITPSSPTKRAAMEAIKPLEPLKPITGGQLVSRVDEGRLTSYPSGSKIQWHAEDGLNEAVKVKGKWHHKVDGKRGHEVRSADSMASKIGDAGVRFDGKPPPTLAQSAASVLNLKDGPYENNARLRRHLEAAWEDPKVRSTALDQLAIDALDYYEEFGSHEERSKLRETAMSSRNENILEGTHVDSDPHTLMHLMSSIATNPTGGSGYLRLLVKDSTTATERSEVAKITHKIKDPQARAMVERALATQKSDDEYQKEAKEKQAKAVARVEAESKLLKPGSLFPGASVGDSWKVKKASRKTVTIFSPGGERAGARFAGKSYTYKWDGTGFKRGGYYLSEDGMVPVSDFEKSMGKAMSIGDWLEKADDGKPGESLEETSTEELTQTKSDLEARIKDLGDKPEAKGLQARLEAISGELKRRGGSEMDKACGKDHKSGDLSTWIQKAKAQPSDKTNLTPEKARQMLHERSGGHGRPITEQQRKFFGAIGGHLPAPGGKTKKGMYGASDENRMEKGLFGRGGEGSRGGKIVGHDAHGKPIYARQAGSIAMTGGGKHVVAPKHHDKQTLKNRTASDEFRGKHEDWQSHDHFDAAQAHEKVAAATKDKKLRQQHQAIAAVHRQVGTGKEHDERKAGGRRGGAAVASKQQKQESAESWARHNEGVKKSMNVNDWLEKALPTHEPRMGGPKSDMQGGSQDGGDWEGKGKTPDNNGGTINAPGQDAMGNVTGADPGKQEKLSEDDEEQGEIGKPDKKKPIEKLGKSELYPMPLTPARQREMVAHEVAKLRKSPEMVTIGPQNHPYGYNRTMGADTEELSKSEGSVDIPTLRRSPGQSLAQSHVLCKSVHPGGCDSTHSAMLTACPDCGAGTTRHRIWPNSSEVQVVPQVGPGGLRPAKRDPLVKIPF